MKARIRNGSIDVEIEGDDEKDILDQFARDYPERTLETIVVEWDLGDAP